MPDYKSSLLIVEENFHSILETGNDKALILMFEFTVRTDLFYSLIHSFHFSRDSFYFFFDIDGRVQSGTIWLKKIIMQLFWQTLWLWCDSHQWEWFIFTIKCCFVVCTKLFLHLENRTCRPGLSATHSPLLSCDLLQNVPLCSYCLHTWTTRWAALKTCFTSWLIQQDTVKY